MRRLYVALRSGMEENKKLCAEEFEEYLKQETRPIEQCRSDTHAIILYLVRKVKSKEKWKRYWCLRRRLMQFIEVNQKLRLRR